MRVAQAEAEAAQNREAEALKREAAAVQQRDKWIDVATKAQKDRDELNGENGELRTRNSALEAKVPMLEGENSAMRATIRKLKKQRWVFALVAGGLGVAVGAGVVTFAVAGK
jgi:uncharacterized protein (DUF3084 family)